MFSQRTSFDPEESLQEQALHRARTKQTSVLDLTVSNPGQCGLAPDAESTLQALQRAEAMRYYPDPRGLLNARKAVAAYYDDAIEADQIVLTAGTSEAYSYLFRLLCDPKDEVLVPRPGYPLFDMLAAFDTIELRSYPLRYDHGWQMDLDALQQAITDRTRAILVVHPNNPTGHATSLDEREALQRIAAERGIALIVDEVFLDYGVEVPGRGTSFVDTKNQALTFVLSGLSKVCALPQMKVAWTAVTGPKELVQAALFRLDLLADTFLSVAMPSQLALPVWLQHRKTVQQQILTRVQANLRQLDEALKGSLVSRLRVDAGWAAVLRVPAWEEDTQQMAELILDPGVVLHPGSFYGFPQKGWAVISLLPEPAVFQTGVNLLIKRIKQVNSR